MDSTKESPVPGTKQERPVSLGSPEVELLLRCVRTRTSSENTDRAVALIQEGMDWELVLRAAYRHGVAALFYSHLSDACPQVVPEPVLEHLRDHFRANRLRNLYLTGELLRAVTKLEERGIPVIPYKGPLLTVHAYGNLALRQFGDLDLLVHKRDVGRASEALTSLGYVPQNRMTKAQETAFARYERQYVFTGSDGVTIELHWTVTPRSVSFLVEPEQLWGRTGQIMLGGGTVSTLSTEDLLLTLCVHGSAHRWESLRWVCDVAEVIRASEKIAWGQLLERARVSSVRRMLLLGLFMANDLFDVDLPENILREVRADAGIRTLATEAREKLFAMYPHSQEGGEEDLDRWRFHLRMLERLWDKVWYCVHQMTTPTLLDWELMPLPTVLFPCYRVLRPIRLLVRFGQRMHDRLPRVPLPAKRWS